jgi:hypothetical protein
VKHQSGDAHLFSQLGHFHLGIHLPKPQPVLRARRDPLELVKAGGDFVWGVGNETGGEEAPKYRIG